MTPAPPPYLDPAQWVLVLLAALATAALARVYQFARRTASFLEASRNCPVEHQCLLQALESNSRAQATATVYLKHAVRLLIVLTPDEDHERASRIQAELADELARLGRRP
jgi:hypothetical protein